MITKYWHNPKLYIAESPIAGEGLFTNATICAGELLVVAGGDLMDRQQFQSYRKTTLGPFSALSLLGDELWLITKSVGQSNSKMNHSCNPNAVIDGQIFWRAFRDIKRDEEICADYSTFTDLDKEADFNPCQCGANLCRSNVTYKDWTLPSVQQHYKTKFSSHILEKMGYYIDK